ncbi:L-lysine exporter family protein LysE/ArgO [Arthrobacter silviterrae]|uniref:Amino acid transporter n=1 Tax=Arthrobacter silviterrae TaxID=2026658 RepID=A0ABX0DEW7_9MICC|nr:MULTISPECIES: LysE/ArgO family amino acid transporter [Arthrobacter]MCU6479985.1 LysE/ArgO family amino acid transporter [Arthrobacter sp. A2-55]MDQ0278301.1 L-lysine exporter family protein LysE/ArgO [Arthrobacter silviterrae]NGN85462.1 amino acid transporter [Arthrobacter silviterrae]
MTPLDILSSAATGLGAGLALIIAIGAQNAFVLRQGLRVEHVGLVVLVCMLSDAVLIAAGIVGIGELIRAAPAVVVVIRLAGAAFLLAYGVFAARRAFRPGTLTASGRQGALGRKAVLATVLALTWLNPHVYLDTVLLLGTLANQHGELRWWFGVGAVLGSVLWFSALGFGARLLRPVFAKPAAWRVLDGAIAVVMAFLAARMAFGF